MRLCGKKIGNMGGEKSALQCKMKCLNGKKKEEGEREREVERKRRKIYTAETGMEECNRERKSESRGSDGGQCELVKIVVHCMNVSLS